MEIQNLVVNPKSRPVKLKLCTITIFTEVRFQQKSMTKFLKINKNLNFKVSFDHREFFLKTLAK